jgi:hypothetical protein
MAAAFNRRYREPDFLHGRLASTKAAARTIVWPQEIFPTGPGATQQQDSLMVKDCNRCPSVGASKQKIEQSLGEGRWRQGLIVADAALQHEQEFRVPSRRTLPHQLEKVVSRAQFDKFDARICHVALAATQSWAANRIV